MAGALISALGLVILSRVNSLALFITGWAITGIGMTGTDTVPAAVVVSHWFTEHRGFAIGIMSCRTISMAMSFGVAAGPLIAGYMFDAMGSYYHTFLIYAILYVFPITAVLAIRHPKIKLTVPRD